MNKMQTLTTLKYFEKISRFQKGFICVALFLVFWLVNAFIYNLNFILIEELLIGVILPILIFSVFFLGYRESVKIDKDSNNFYIECELSELIILLNSCGFDLQKQVGSYYLMSSRFLMQSHQKLIVTEESDQCIVFGNKSLIQMISRDITKLKDFIPPKKHNNSKSSKSNNCMNHRAF